LTDFNRFSPLYSETITAHIWNNIFQFTLTALPHYRVKCEQAQFCETSHCST